MTKAEMDAEVTRKHAELYPSGCPLMCEECALRMSRKPTPGPWETVGRRDRYGRIIVTAEDGVAVALVCARASSPLSGPRYYEREANAKLIAAVPEMLELLKRAGVVLDADGIVYGDSDDEPLDVLGGINALLARVEGR